MHVSSDLAQAVSTQYEAWFLESYNTSAAVVEAQYNPLVQPLMLENFQGNRINLNWLGAAPQVREWTDEKRAIGLGKYDWEIVVKRWEATQEIDLDFLADNRWNLYEPRLREMAQNATRHRYNLISDLIRLGASALCYDGQNFFDTDHSEGDSGTQSNKLTGSGADSLAHVRSDYFRAKAALMQFKDDKGEPIWAGDFRPLIWCPADPTLMEYFETLRGEETLAISSGSQSNNILRNKFDIVYDPKQTDTTDWEMFNPEGPMKPFISVNREEFHYEDNFGTGHPDVWGRRIGQASVVGRDNMTYGLWQKAVRIVNS